MSYHHSGNVSTIVYLSQHLLGNNTFQKGASLTAAPSVHLEVGSPGFLPGTQRPAFPMWRRGTVARQVTHHSLVQQLACIVYMAPAQVIFIY